MKKVALVTGASSGIGESTALELLADGFTVYGAARSTNKMGALRDKGVKIISLDVTVDSSIVECVETIIKNEGRIDVLVNNAGYGSYGAVEDVSIEEAKRQFEVNIFGLARLTQLVLPSMRGNKSGKIVNISSMGGRCYTAYGAWYHATKYALEGWSDCLRLEVEKAYGINVIIIEPGGIKTPWGTIAADNLKEVSKGGAYEESANRVSDAMREVYLGNSLSEPSLIGRTIRKAVTARKPKTRYLIGANAKPMVFMRNVLCDRTYDAIIRKMFKL